MYEVWYNWKYAKEHNPTLMGFGYTGGFGMVRRRMMDAVKQGDRTIAEAQFWYLIKQSKEEMRRDYEYEHGTEGDSEGFWSDSLGYWMSEDAYSGAERHFIREIEEPKPWWRTFYKDLFFWGVLYIVVFGTMLINGYPGGTGV